MCSNESPPPAKEPLAVGLGNPMANFLPGLEHYRLHLYHYAMAERLRLAQQIQHPGVAHPPSGAPTAHLGMSPGFPAPLPLYPAAAAAAGYPGRLALSMALLHPHHQRIPEEPKPQHSYIGLIAMAILSSPEKKLVLSDIYQHILEHYPYFRTRGPGWRNSIRHNLSLNDCFVKSGRSANGKGHYWAIHPANLEDFRRGDFRRRKAQRKVRRHMGLAVDEEPDSPSPPPLPASPPPPTALGPSVASQPISLWTPHHHHQQQQQQQQHQQHQQQQQNPFQSQSLRQSSFQPSRKRQFDVASLLAPDDQQHQIEADVLGPVKSRRFSCSEDELHDLPEGDQDDEDVDVDVVADANALPSPSTPPSASPDMPKVVSPAAHWNHQSVQSGGHQQQQQQQQQQLSAVHLHNHLHVRNYYIPANSAGGSSV
ncbi:fork head domain-containing protein FD4-like [Pogonomyrmex barbatus]|uniref:Fork head domain-containing protein FD4-like n=1 Tax=Pogonomyrmex barbatus TaxID=144034 RepID=A0A6I9W0E6_9HYME|nr:fork head domain-containing protein FD4-like [Pogonomyrmex barbatus]